MWIKLSYTIRSMTSQLVFLYLSFYEKQLRYFNLMTANWKKRYSKLNLFAQVGSLMYSFSSILTGKNILQACSYAAAIIYQTRILQYSKEIASLRFCFK